MSGRTTGHKNILSVSVFWFFVRFRLDGIIKMRLGRLLNLFLLNLLFFWMIYTSISSKYTRTCFLIIFIQCFFYIFVIEFFYIFILLDAFLYVFIQYKYIGLRLSVRPNDWYRSNYRTTSRVGPRPGFYVFVSFI